jgi:hypothetical protein
MIVSLGWGSLIWCPQKLPIEGDWQNDGPALPIEFVRQSNNGRLTLVIDQLSQPMPVLWAELKVSDLSEAVEQLKIREGTTCKKIGRWPDANGYEYGNEIGDWAKSKGISGVVWTALGPKFDGVDGRRPTQIEAIQYLEGLTGDARKLAKEYVEKAPPPIDTDYRRAFSSDLGWHQKLTCTRCQS